MFTFVICTVWEALCSVKPGLSPYPLMMNGMCVCMVTDGIDRAMADLEQYHVNIA